jgi:hemolysin activation/secretion protein
MSKTFVSVDRTTQIGGSDQDAYWNSAAGTGSRPNAEKNFWIWNFNATHFRYLEAEKIQRVLASVRYIRPNRRLISSKMTTFGGMYSVRGYTESAIVADGGILASFQYEYDLVKHGQAQAVREGQPREAAPTLRKFAPVAFFDYGRADKRDSLSSENGREELYSVGGGFLVEYGKSLSGGVYYGYPLKAATGTATGDGRINIFVMLQW